MKYNSYPALQINNLHKYLGEGENRTHVLRGINLSIEKSKLYAVIGPSGCGKSTMLYLLGLLDRPDRGQILINGQLVHSKTDRERTETRNRHIGFIFQFHFLLMEFSALENIMLPMHKLGVMDKGKIKRKAMSLLREVGLDGKSKRLANQLSGGEQQRVAVARALANSPSLVLADEPTGNLDAKNSETIFNLLKNLSHNKGQSIVMVTHNTELANQADVIINMHDGLIIE